MISMVIKRCQFIKHHDYSQLNKVLIDQMIKYIN